MVAKLGVFCYAAKFLVNFFKSNEGCLSHIMFVVPTCKEKEQTCIIPPETEWIEIHK